MSDAALDETLKSVFSLLPPTQAEEARKALLHRLNTLGPANSEDITWAEYRGNGSFVRGGFSSHAEKTTQLVSSSQEAPEIAMLSRLVAEKEASTGAILWKATTDRLYWFVPVTPSSPGSVEEPRLRGFSIPLSVFSELVLMFNPDAGATSGELRAAFQLTGNVELRDAAEADGVSYETKRAHIKTLCSKMQCSGQRELVSKIIGQLVHLISVTESSASHSELLENFVARYLSDDVSLKAQRLPNGRLIRFLECGPQGGREVVLIHGIMFPISLYGLAKHMDAQNIKLVIPIREGFFENRSLASFYSEADPTSLALDDIALFLKGNCETPCTVVGNSLGAVVALKFATAYPEFVKRLILVGTNLKTAKPREEYVATQFYGAMKSLSESADLFKMVSWEFKRYYADEKTCAAILRSLFGGSQTDLEVLDGKYNNVAAYRMFSETYQHSLMGVSEDLGMVVRLPKEEFGSLSMPATFIQGDQDPLTPPDDLVDIAADADQQDVTIIKAAGHFLAVSHPKEVWSQIADLIDG